MTGTPATEKLAALDWRDIETTIASQGYARTNSLLSPDACHGLIELYEDDARFRSRIDMARYRFGQGDYAYFAEPLPDVVAELRGALYAHLAPIANRMMTALRAEPRYPDTLAAYRRQCQAAGQTKPTPLLLRYSAGGYNCLHRDLYGDLLFPLQATIMLSRREQDYRGGEFLLVENRPRQQSRGTAIAPDQGEMLIFPVFERPVEGKRGMLRAAMRHGVSQIHDGERYALGIIFHDAA